MSVLEVSSLMYRYGRHDALNGVDFTVPEGALYALLGPNGSGKTTLLQIVMGLRRPRSGRVRVMGVDSTALTWRDRGSIAYVAEGQPLPDWMRLEQLEAYLAPLYPTWDPALARELRERFELNPTQKLRALSRGERMKAALLCALAPRPRLLVMDEPFTGMDALVKDELVRGLLTSAGSEGWTVLLCSHDIGELELLADYVGFLDRGRMQLSEPMEVVRNRFKHVDVLLSETPTSWSTPSDWLSVDQAGQHMSFVMTHETGDSAEHAVAARLPGAARVDVRDATLREVFVALARRAPALGGVVAEGAAA
jgi:ABC-2 type transport system ATP-binding protein